jgi:hypothetical protein
VLGVRQLNVDSANREWRHLKHRSHRQNEILQHLLDLGTVKESALERDAVLTRCVQVPAAFPIERPSADQSFCFPFQGLRWLCRNPGKPKKGAPESDPSAHFAQRDVFPKHPWYVSRLVNVLRRLVLRIGQDEVRL